VKAILKVATLAVLLLLVAITGTLTARLLCSPEAYLFRLLWHALISA
jgi:hypothetical protein